MTLDSVPRVHPEAAVQQVAGRWVAATADEKLHSFEDDEGPSPVAERIVSLIDGQRTVRAIAAVLVSEFDVPLDVAERETLDFIELLAQKHVLAL